MKFEHSFFVGVQDVDRRKSITNRALIEMFSNLATMHGISVGQTASEGVSPVSWVVLGWKLSVYKRANLCDTIRVRTWGQGGTRLRANRDFDAYDANGELLARATSVWVALDGKTGAFLKLTPEIVDPFAPEPDCVNFPDHRFPNVHHLDLPVLASMEMRPARKMVDYNEHVHNAAYLDLADEILPEEVYRTAFSEVEIVYKQEIHPEEEALLEYAVDGGRHVVMMRDRGTREMHAVVFLGDR